MAEGKAKQAEESTASWTRPALPSRTALIVLGALVVLFNVPLIHYFVFRAEPKATAALPYANDFSDRATVERDFFSAGGLWRVENGALVSPGVRNNPLWLQAKLPQDVAVDFDVRTTSPEGDVRVELFGDGSANESGYVLVHGGWNNQVSVIARLDDNAPAIQSLDQKAYRSDTRARVEARGFKVEPGRPYHWHIERRGRVIVWALDGVEVARFDDPFPLTGKGHDRFGFVSWESQLYFDNLRVVPLDGSAPVPAPPPPLARPPEAPQPTGSPVFTDDFERKEPGDDYLLTGPDAFKIENGALVGQLVHNRPAWLKRAMPKDAVVEFDAWTDDPNGDIKIEAWGDGRSFYSGDLKQQYTASGYVFILGGWKNTASVIARQWEHAPNQPTRTDLRVQPGKRYHFKITKKDGQIAWQLDGQPFLGAKDPSPLPGAHLGFSGWETKVHFDNLRITPY